MEKENIQENFGVGSALNSLIVNSWSLLDECNSLLATMVDLGLDIDISPALNEVKENITQAITKLQETFESIDTNTAPSFERLAMHELEPIEADIIYLNQE